MKEIFVSFKLCVEDKWECSQNRSLSDDLCTLLVVSGNTIHDAVIKDMDGNDILTVPVPSNKSLFRKKTEEQVVEIVKNMLGIKGNIGLDTDLVYKYQCDSLDMMEIQIEIEKRFQIQMPSLGCGVRTINQLVDMVEELVREKLSPSV